MAWLVLKDELLCRVTLVLQCQLAKGFLSWIVWWRERAMIQTNCHQKEPLLCINGAAVTHSNRMQTTLSRRRWDKARTNLSWSRTLKWMVFCFLVLFWNDSHGGTLDILRKSEVSAEFLKAAGILLCSVTEKYSYIGHINFRTDITGQIIGSSTFILSTLH